MTLSVLKWLNAHHHFNIIPPTHSVYICKIFPFLSTIFNIYCLNVPVDELNCWPTVCSSDPISQDNAYSFYRTDYSKETVMLVLSDTATLHTTYTNGVVYFILYLHHGLMSLQILFSLKITRDILIKQYLIKTCSTL